MSARLYIHLELADATKGVQCTAMFVKLSLADPHRIESLQRCLVFETESTYTDACAPESWRQSIRQPKQHTAADAAHPSAQTIPDR